MNLKNAKIYFPVESLTGIGHFNRSGKVVQELVSHGAKVHVASGTFVDPERFFKGAELIKMPDYIFYKDEVKPYLLDEDGHDVIIENFDEHAYKKARIEAHIKNYDAIKPDVLICEYWPFDRADLDDEMRKLLRYSKEQSQGKTLHVLAVRDILNLPAKGDEAKEDARQKWAAEAINEFFDILIIYGDENFIAFNETFAHFDAIKTKKIYAGYVMHDLSERKESDESEILISFGSGEGAAPAAKKIIEAWMHMHANRNNESFANMVEKNWHMVCGPRFPLSQMKLIEKAAAEMRERQNAKITIDRYRNDYTKLMAEAAFSISFAGYNTSLETLAIGVPCFFIPKFRVYSNPECPIKVNSEQLYRLEKLSKLNAAEYALPDELADTKLFAEKIANAYSNRLKSQKAVIKIKTNGATVTAEEIEKALVIGK